MVHKGCGGVTIQSATRLPVEEQVVLLAIFCQLHDINAKTARSELDAEPRRWLDEAVSWTAANAGVVGLVRSDRLAIDADSYRLAPARGWLARVLGIGRAKGPSVPTDDELERMASRISTAAQVDPEKARRMAALREIVDEQLE
jgi:hypothetical protein